MAKEKPAPARARAKAWFGLAFGGLFALVGLILLTVAWLPLWNDYRHGKQFVAEGGVALGMVLTKSRASAGSVTVLGFTEHLVDYSVRYRFSTLSGRKIEGDAKVTPEEWGFLQERGPVKVRYVQGDPETSHIPGQESSRSRSETLIFTLIGAVFSAMGGLMMFIVLKDGKSTP